MPHKCIQVSAECFLGSTYTKTGKVQPTAAARYFVARPTERASVVQSLFWVVPGTGLEPTRAWHGQKYLRPRRHSPNRGHLRRHVIKPTPRRGKSLGERPLDRGGNLQLPWHTWPDLCRSKHGRPKCNTTTGEAQCYNSYCPLPLPA